MEVAEALEQGQQAYAQGAWSEAHASLARADDQATLDGDDLERLATAAYMLGRDGDYLDALERAHQAHLEAGAPLAAVRCAFWLGMQLAMAGETARAGGWFGRARRLVERQDEDCAEAGYLLLPAAVRHAAAGEYGQAAATAGRAAEIAERLGDPDLLALALQEQGRALARDGDVVRGLALLDEAMVAVAAGELSPIVTGLLYCTVIDGCQEVHALDRAQQWTTALSRWCEKQPDMVAFTGRCLMHRAEILQVRGEWDDALAEARRAAGRLARTASRAVEGHAFYREGEVHRLQGRFAAAEEAYRTASRCGCEPQPGLALLRLAQGRPDAAAAAIRRAAAETTEPLERARILPAFVEISLAVGEVEDARAACDELDEIARRCPSPMLEAAAAHARGALELDRGDAGAALTALRRAWQRWDALGTPYEAARTRLLLGLACRQAGDQDSARLELDAARELFSSLGAAPDVARLDALAGRGSNGATHGLTEREVEVLRLVAAGRTNRQIAADLVISEHTVARHVQNIFAKLGVSSRTAAGAFAFEHDLV